MIIIIRKKRYILASAAFLIFVMFLCASVSESKDASLPVSADGKALLAIIIDDFGNNSQGTEEMLSLPIKFTGAVMPSMPYTSEECEKLHSAGKEVFLHLPMEAHTGKLSYLGASPILGNFSAEKAREVTIENLSQIKYCAGINNHMGSLVSENETLMQSILSVAKENGLIFADSVTSAKSKSYETAENMGIRAYKRDVFLDSTQDVEKIKQNIIKAAKIAKDKGYAVAIGHVGPEGGKATYKALASLYEPLQKENVEFVFVSELP